MQKALLREPQQSSLIEYLSDLCVEKSTRSPESFLICALLQKVGGFVPSDAFSKAAEQIEGSIGKLIQYLLHGDSCQESSGNPLFIDERFYSKTTPDSWKGTKRLTFELLLAYAKGVDSALLTNHVYLLKELYDHKGRPFVSAWMRDEDFHYSELIAWHNVLFYLVGVPFEQKHIVSKKIPLLPLLIADYFQQYLQNNQTATQELAPNLGEWGAGKCQFDSLCILSTFTGSGTALGAIHADYVQILAHGPHFLPLGEIEKFGVNRGCHAPFEDIHMTDSSISGLSKLTGTQSWIDHKITKEENGVELLARYFQLSPGVELAYAFFIKAEKALIGDLEIRRKSLDHFSDHNQDVIFYQKDEKIILSAQFEGEMQVIPLVGDDHFWGADYLLAYMTPSADVAYRFQLKL